MNPLLLVLSLAGLLAAPAFGAESTNRTADPRTADPQTWLRSLAAEWTADTNSTNPATPQTTKAKPPAGPMQSPPPPAPRPSTQATLPAHRQPAPAANSSPAESVVVAPARLADGDVNARLLRDPAALAALMASLDDTKKLGPGDKITCRVLEDRDETKPLTVGDSGDVDIPYYGLVQAEKRTCKQLGLEIKKLLEKRDYRRATVIISLQEINRKRILGKVYVVGQVRQSGPQEIPDDEVFTVSKAILKAGGFSDFADKRNVRLIRGGLGGGASGHNTLVINVAEVWEKGKVGNDLAVQPDDMVFVPKRAVNF